MSPTAVLHRAGGTDGPAVLLIHGFGADRLVWAGLMPRLLPAHRVWAVDLPGHGTAPGEVGDATPAALATAVAGAVAPLGEPLLVVGHSLGGAVALTLAEARPDLVRGLVLLAPAGLGLGLDGAFLDALPALATEEEALALLGRLVATPRFVAPAMARHLLGSLDAPDRREALRRIARHADAPAPSLPTTIPWHVVWGAGDRINPPDPARLAAWGERATLLPGVGHLPQVEAASAVAAAIQAL